MRVRQFVIAVAAASIATAAAAADPTGPARNSAQPAELQAPVVVASAEPVRSPAVLAQGAAPAPAKRVRTARVSSCRCGGQTPTEN